MDFLDTSSSIGLLIRQCNKVTIKCTFVNTNNHIVTCDAFGAYFDTVLWTTETVFLLKGNDFKHSKNGPQWKILSETRI